MELLFSQKFETLLLLTAVVIIGRSLPSTKTEKDIEEIQFHMILLNNGEKP